MHATHRFCLLVFLATCLGRLLELPTLARTAEPPKGEVLKFTFNKSRIYPGTAREYSVYIPAQYNPARPACVYVNQDGVQYNAPAVFDALINAGEMPITIGIFVSPGRVPAARETALDRFNRSLEYDTLSPAYARFLLEELLPDVESRKTGDGRAIQLSKKPEDRAIGGASSGAICAFTVAWERPDAFRRVFSAVGTYVGIHGGNIYPTLVRKTEPKPLRIFLQDGSNDLNVNRGDWWMANQELERALVFAGYEVEHRWGEGGHDVKQATEVFPEAMRWLWKGWPESPRAGAGSPQFQAICEPGTRWQRVSEARDRSFDVTGLACDPEGAVVFADNAEGRLFRIDPDGALDDLFVQRVTGSGELAFGPDGSLYMARLEIPVGLYRFSKDAEEPEETSADWPRDRNFAFSDVTVDHTGRVYVADYGDPSNRVIRVIDPFKPRREFKIAAIEPRGVVLSPDQSILYVTDAASHWIWSYIVQEDGSLVYGQKFTHLHVPDSQEDADARGLAVDQDGRLYVGTNMGIQVCDPAGRADCIIPGPAGSVSLVTFGGKERNMLYAVSGGVLYRRPVKVKGAEGLDPPSKPPTPRL